MKRVTLVVACACAALLLPAAAADAKLPKSGEIVIGKGVAGVKLGMKPEDAVKKWGKGGSCDEVVSDDCRWEGANGSTIRFEAREGKIVTIVIRAGQRANGTPVYSGPITKWKTSKGVGIGTALATIQKKYKKAQPDGSGVSIVSGKRTTGFESSGGRAFSIYITNIPV